MVSGSAGAAGARFAARASPLVQGGDGGQRQGCGAGHPEERARHVAAFSREEDGDGHGLGAAGNIARQHEGGAEFAERAGEREHGAGQDSGLGEREQDAVEGAPFAGAEGARGAEQVGADLLKPAQGSAVHQGKCHHGGGDDRAGPGKYDAEAEVLQGAADDTGAAEDEEQEEASDGGREHQREDEDAIQPSAAATAIGGHGARGGDAEDEGERGGGGRGLERNPQRGEIEAAHRATVKPWAVKIAAASGEARKVENAPAAAGSRAPRRTATG